MINILPQQTATISLILLKPVTFKIPGFPQELELKEGSKLIRTSEELQTSDQTPEYNFDWSLIDQDEPLHEIAASVLEQRFENPETRIEYFDLYVKPFVDVPDISNIEKMVTGDNETYNLRLSFKTQEAANELANHIEAVYQNKKAMFDLADTIPTILEACQLIIGCTCVATQEELDALTPVEQEIEDYTEPKHDSFVDPITEAAQASRNMI